MLMVNRLIYYTIRASKKIKLKNYVVSSDSKKDIKYSKKIWSEKIIFKT